MKMKYSSLFVVALPALFPLVCKGRPEPSDPKSITTHDQEMEEDHKAKSSKLELACVVVLLGFTPLICIMFLPKNSVDKHILQAIATFGIWAIISGIFLLIHTTLMMLTKSNICSHPIHHTISRGLTLMSYTALVLASLPLPLLPKPYNFLIPIVLTTVLLALGAHFYLRSVTNDKKSDEQDPNKDEEHQKEITRLSELDQVVLSLSSGGLIGLLFGIHKKALNHTHHLIDKAIVSLIVTSFIFSIFLIYLCRMRLIHLSSSTRGKIITIGFWFCILLLILLAFSALSIAYTFLKVYTPIVFLPVLVVCVVWIIMKLCTGGSIQANIGEEELNWAYTIGNKVTSISFGEIVAIFSGYLGSSSNDSDMHLNVCMVFVTSAFLSGLSLMLISCRPTRSRIGIVVDIQTYYAVCLLVFAAFTIFIVEFVQF